MAKPRTLVKLHACDLILLGRYWLSYTNRCSNPTHGTGVQCPVGDIDDSHFQTIDPVVLDPGTGRVGDLIVSRGDSMRHVTEVEATHVLF